MTRRVLGAVADSGPVVILAGIAAAGSFTHIRDTATEHGQRGWMAWAIAVCIDLTCVMAAGERQRDKRTGRETGRLSWPTVVLVGGILLSLAANLAQADPSVWGWITAGTPAGAFLVAVSMLERRKAGTRPAGRPSPVPDSFGRPEPSPSSSSSGAPSVPSPVAPASSPWVVWERPTVAAAAAHAPGDQDNRDQGEDEQDGQTSIPVPTERPASTAPASSASSSSDSSSSAPAGPLVDFARRVASEHETEHGRPITRDALRARLGVSNQLASDLLRQIRTEATASVS
ncbi:DUF2637 domain-containing protein [Actinomadura madurae]|uniref:DUF2637 domain-containing protein n=1 Tax=Actinomadura madurae TaxID=1993 RepID=UPI0020D228B9|nr:DUF2637 domain-containing protein [Actinomadura madurae]MCP9951688.1 DUF2637 domain-containing protein [Actinomadura madurae]MCP9968460.1 DUF2637 domain-containing protein [Actinomadura madurae]MCP9980932.1 DUF2637 domain-containing protein [Actinomadura madurae]MCQ0007567.1 DUF2637 domain-containing protein [Actinomadura madurae]MCQ0017126.1 DUF2637 domain-containing protein [Actinomadura madurae]